MTPNPTLSEREAQAIEAAEAYARRLGARSPFAAHLRTLVQAIRAPVAPAEPVADELRLRLKLAKAGGADVIKFSPAEVENLLAALATPAQPSTVSAEALQLIASGWEVIEGDGRFVTIQAPKDWDEDGERERTFDTHLLTPTCSFWNTQAATVLSDIGYGYGPDFSGDDAVSMQNAARKFFETVPPPAPSPVTPEAEKARIMQAVDAGEASALCFYDSHTREDRFASLIRSCRSDNVRGVHVLNREKLAEDLEAVASPVTGALAEAQAEIERLKAALNTPEVEDFSRGVVTEAQHQRERWGADHDAGKEPLDWFWLIGFLAQKAATSQMAGDSEKAKHHTISTAAALANWHAQINGDSNAMRPGIEPPAALAAQKAEG